VILSLRPFAARLDRDHLGHLRPRPAEHRRSSRRRRRSLRR